MSTQQHMCDRIAALVPLLQRADVRDEIAKLEQMFDLATDVIAQQDTELAAATTDRGAAIREATSPLFAEIAALREVTRNVLNDNSHLRNQVTELQRECSRHEQEARDARSLLRAQQTVESEAAE